MLYLHSLPIQVWQRIAGAWTAYNFNASVIQDVSKYDGSRLVTFDFGTGKDAQGYTPRINDILIPFADMKNESGEGGSFQFFGSRANQPYFWEGVNNNWKTRPGILFLSAYNDSKIQFCDFNSVKEYGLAPAGKSKLTTLTSNVASTVWNRLTAGHPILKSVTPEHTFNLGIAVDYGSVTYDTATPVLLSDLTSKMVQILGYIKSSGVMYTITAGEGWLIWLSAEEQKSLSFDIRLEDVAELEVRSRDSSDSPNFMVWYTEAGQSGGIYYNASGKLVHGTPAANSNYSLRTVYEQTDDDTNAVTEAKAREVLKASPALDLVDISIVFDMTNRYSIVYSEDRHAAWSLPVPGTVADVFGYLQDKSIQLPVRAYEFATGKLLLATNDDITLETGL